MFFFSGGSSILPYILYLALIWGVFLVNGLVCNTVKKEIRETSISYSSHEKTEKSFNVKTYDYRDNTKSGKVEKHLEIFDNTCLWTFKLLPKTDDLIIGNLTRFLINCYSFRAPPQLFTS